MNFKEPILLKCPIQHYAWGENGVDAFIPNLTGKKGRKNTPYAELWMGSHPNGPSLAILDGDEHSLIHLIESHPREILGNRIKTLFPHGGLPYLFKVLSAGTSLSIQAHPDKKLAEQLNKEDPDHYKDTNHKPEIAIALHNFKVLYGFKEADKLVHVLKVIPELASLVSKKNLKNFFASLEGSERDRRNTFKKVYHDIMSSTSTALDKALGKLTKRIQKKPTLGFEEAEERILDLSIKYPGDVGLFSFYLYNLVELEPGQGIFQGPGVPHAYLQGHLIECMANSDNVVRAGLTPKFKDIEVLVSMLTYEMGPPDILMVQGRGNLQEYPSPVKEFKISRIQFKEEGEALIKAKSGPHILLVLSGSLKINNTIYQKGQVLLLAHDMDKISIGGTEALAFMASPNL